MFDRVGPARRQFAWKREDSRRSFCAETLIARRQKANI